MIKKQKTNFLNWSVLGNAEIKKVCYKEFSLGQGIFFSANIYKYEKLQ